MLDGFVDCKQLTIEGDVLGFCCDSFMDKKAMGFQSSSCSCWRTAPTPVSEASVQMAVIASGAGKQSYVAWPMVLVASLKACIVGSDHAGVSD